MARTPSLQYKKSVRVESDLIPSLQPQQGGRSQAKCQEGVVCFRLDECLLCSFLLYSIGCVSGLALGLQEELVLIPGSWFCCKDCLRKLCLFGLIFYLKILILTNTEGHLRNLNVSDKALSVSRRQFTQWGWNTHRLHNSLQTLCSHRLLIHHLFINSSRCNWEKQPDKSELREGYQITGDKNQTGIYVQTN